jgi:Asp-tRNA(Asn)/Glu-tRNA(Gln) amidotransferase A subunit family amidase
MTQYDLKSLDLPKMSGAGLRLFASAVASPLLRPFLMGRLLETGGVNYLRKAVVDETPTFQPPVNPLAYGGEPLVVETLADIRSPQTEKNPFKTIRSFAEAYREERTTPMHVAQSLLDGITESDSGDLPLNAFIATDPDDLMAQAKAATQRLQQGEALSILDGVPVAIKDELNQVPYPRTAGTAFWGTEPVTEDATLVARLRAAGALLIGKANMHEIGIEPNGANAHYGAARNPYNPMHDTGGSSSGPAAAVAAGFCPVSIGADGGGSIRVPAAFCGLVGLKATYGRISEHGAAPLCWSVAHNGPLGVSVEDIALVYAAIAGADPLDRSSIGQPPVTLEGWNTADLTGLTLGVYPEWNQHAAPEVVSACEAMLEEFRRAGAQIKEITIPDLNLMRIAHIAIILSEMATSMQLHWQHQGDFGNSTRITLEIARQLTSRDYVKAQQVRTRALRIFDEHYSEVDVIISPATGTPAPVIPAGGRANDWSDLSATTEMMRFVFPANLTGLPAVSFPVGYTESGLPIGMQAMGRRWQEHILLRVAYTAEQRIERRLPEIHFPLIP